MKVDRVARLVVLPLVLLTALGASCPGPTPMPAPQPGAWLVFLCRATDAPLDPHPLAHYGELFDRNQRDLLFDYFQDASGGRVDVAGTEVYGWYTMPQTTASMAPAVRNATTQPNRSQTAQDCRAAGVAALLATGRSIDPSRYAGFIAVINVPVDSGATGSSLVANADDEAAFYAHEMLHVYGLDHSYTMAADLSADHSWESGADRAYDDCWDIMSFATCTHRFPTPPHGRQGPELEIAYREKLNWAPAGRVTEIDTTSPSPRTVTIPPVSEPGRPGPLLTRITTPGGATYGVEYRRPSGFDRAIPRPAVIIRELRRDGRSYLVTRRGGSHEWAQGEQFTDAANFLRVTVDAVAAQSATITVEPRFANPAGLGEICGNKYVGAVRACPAGAVCQARRTPPLVSIDYFCQ